MFKRVASDAPTLSPGLRMFTSLTISIVPVKHSRLMFQEINMQMFSIVSITSNKRVSETKNINHHVMGAYETHRVTKSECLPFEIFVGMLRAWKKDVFSGGSPVFWAGITTDNGAMAPARAGALTLFSNSLSLTSTRSPLVKTKPTFPLMSNSGQWDNETVASHLFISTNYHYSPEVTHTKIQKMATLYIYKLLVLRRRSENTVCVVSSKRYARPNKRQ
ncbi:hypothetical protein YQE_10476, partial [Dendroctonus ponderosae]